MIKELNCASMFYKSAVGFCAYVRETNITTAELDCLIRWILSLYLLALQLPDDNPDAPEPPPINPHARIEPKIQFRNDYWIIFNPFNDETPVACSLYDDLSDICKDLQEGIAEYEAGCYDNAVFLWNLSFNCHWGQHAVDAIKALHTLRTE